jgi:hypothetical protein
VGLFLRVGCEEGFDGLGCVMVMEGGEQRCYIDE